MPSQPTGKLLKKERSSKSETYLRERAALRFLQRADPALYAAAQPYAGAILSRVHPLRTRKALFERLATSIVNQQLSTRAAASILTRVKQGLGGAITPHSLMEASPARLRSLGLSQAKVRSLKELARAVKDGTLDLLALKKVPPEEAIAVLTAQRGIGPWTAEMFLIFALGSPDVFSPGDLILARGMQRVLKLPKTVSNKEMASLSMRWSPHRSYVSLLLWKLNSEASRGTTTD